jgi:hypothetical protein
MGELIVLALWLCPPGKPTIYTPGSLAMRTLPLGCRDKNGAGFIADRASESLTVSTLGSFISFFYITHTITSKNSYYDQKNCHIDIHSVLFHRHQATYYTANTERNYRQNS